MKRTASGFGLAFAYAFAVLAIVGSGLACADERPSREIVWEGYLYRGAGGRIRLGTPVVAMGVMAQPPHIVTGGLATKLEPLVSDAKGDFVFWNYRLEREGREALEGLPRALVKLKGRVEHIGGDDPDVFSSTAGERRFLEGRLKGVEFVSDDWLLLWATFYRPEGSPFRIRMDEVRMKGEALAAFARKAKDTLKSMRELPGATAAQRALLRGIDPEARVLEVFRRRTESNLLRWLEATNEKQKLGLDLVDLGTPLPEGFELQRLFLEAPDKKTFFAKVRARWSGDLEVPELPYYDSDPSSTWYARVDLRTVQDDWTEADYLRYRTITARMVGR